MACWLYESLLLFAVTFFATWLFSTLGQMRSGMDPRRHLLDAFLLVVLGIYFAWFWAKGQTLAMKTWRLRVVDLHGKPLTQLRALLRYAIYCLWLLPPLAAKDLLGFSLTEVALAMVVWLVGWTLLSRFRADGQFWPDVWAGSRLIVSEPLGR